MEAQPKLDSPVLPAILNTQLLKINLSLLKMTVVASDT